MILKKLENKVREVFADYIPAHDLKHILRVATLAKKIAEKEGYSLIEAEAAALVHDFGRTLNVGDFEHAEAGLQMAREALETETELDVDAIERVLDAVSQHAGVSSTGKLANILQDADKLDGLGAMGIARGYIARSDIEDYGQKLKIDDKNEGRKVGTIVAQLKFQMEWLEMMYTDTAKKMASERHQFMVNFLERLKQEIEEADFEN